MKPPSITLYFNLENGLNCSILMRSKNTIVSAKKNTIVQLFLAL